MTRKIPLATFAAAQCLLIDLVAPAPARAADIPAYFFKEWTVTANCTEAHAGLAARVQAGLKFRISKDTATEEGSYTLEALDGHQQKWAAEWNRLKLENQHGTN